jgi:polyhydroxyalkanoate synthesis repressor PhaR
MSEARIIKRYANRKLYDTQHSRYVTLEQIAEMIRAGDDVKIIDNKSKEDLTSVTLAQIIFEEEKKQKSFLPLQAMRNIIQTGGESISQFVNEAKRSVTNILPVPRKGDEVSGEGVAAAPVAGSTPIEDDETYAGARRVKEGLGSLREFREWLQHTQRTIDDWQRKVDGRIRHVVEGMTPFNHLQKDVKVLTSRIAELEEKLVQVAMEERRAAMAAGLPISDENGLSDKPLRNGDLVD